MTDDDKIVDMLLSWEEGREQGNVVTAEELCRECPELYDTVRERIRLLEKAGWLREPAATAPLKPRTLVERYALEQLIGVGGYAQVWRAYDLQLHRHVAVKVPKPSRTLTAAQIEDVLTEARQIARLKHVNIVTVHDVVKEGAGYFIVTDLIDGETLAERLKRGPMSPIEAAQLLAEVARVIDYAHAQGVIHRDLKPANIFLDKAGRPHVGDFGLARSREDLIGGSDQRGTLAYSSPEQLEGKPLDGRSDIWSLGVILYEMLTGRLPFADDNPVRLRQTILSGKIPDTPAVPIALMEVCRRCLAVKPDERFASGHELACALSIDDTRRRIRWFPWFVVLIGIVATLAIMWWFLWQGASTEPDNPNAIYIGTRQAALHWRVTGAGATDAPAFPFGGRQQEISLTDTGSSVGRMIQGGNLEQFNGFWVATRRFTLPAEVETVSLSFSNFQCDNRGVLLFNGKVIGDYRDYGPGEFSIALTSGTETNYRFNNATSGIVESGFVPGRENTLAMIVNNVKGEANGKTHPFLSFSDGTHAGVDATIVFTLPSR